MGWWHRFGGAPGYGPGFHGGFGGGGGIFGGLMMLIVLGLVIVLAVWAIRALSRARGGGPGSFTGPAARSSEDDALEIARERYARGEIDRDAYQQLRRSLSNEGGR